MHELVERLQDTIEALKREIVRNPKSDKYQKALKVTGERVAIAKQILAREEARASHSINQSPRRPGDPENSEICFRQPRP
jgi:hypothetical protein